MYMTCRMKTREGQRRPSEFWSHDSTKILGTFQNSSETIAAAGPWPPFVWSVAMMESSYGRGEDIWVALFNGGAALRRGSHIYLYFFICICFSPFRQKSHFNLWIVHLSGCTKIPCMWDTFDWRYFCTVFAKLASLNDWLPPTVEWLDIILDFLRTTCCAHVSSFENGGWVKVEGCMKVFFLYSSELLTPI